MPINVTCDNCGTGFTTADEHGGKRTQCPKCSARIMIPKQEDIEFRKDLEQLARLGTSLDARDPGAEEPGVQEAESERPDRAEPEPAGPMGASRAIPETDEHADHAADAGAESGELEFQAEEPEVADEPEGADEPEPAASPAAREERPVTVEEPTGPAEESEMSAATSEAPSREWTPDTAAAADDASAGKRRLLKAMSLVIVFGIAFVLIECFQVARDLTEQRNRPISLHSLAEGVVGRSRNVPARLAGLKDMLPVEREAPAASVVMAPISKPWSRLDRFVFVGALVLLAVRLLFKTKVLESIHLTGPSASERGVPGLILHFCVLMLLVAVLAGTAALTKLQPRGQELACASAGWLLVLAALWLLGMYCYEKGAYPHVAGWGINNALTGLLIVVVALLIPTRGIGTKFPTTRGTAVVVLLLLNSAIAFAIGSRSVFETERAGRVSRRIGFLLVSVLLVVLIGAVLIGQH